MSKSISYKQPLKKLLLSQFGAAVLGLMMNLPTSTLENSHLLDLCTSLLAIAFFLYIQFTAMWDIGAKDRIAIDGKRLEEDKLYGLKASLFANIPNFILAFVCFASKLVFVLFEAVWAETASFISYLVALVWNGMYIGVLENLIPDKNSGIAAAFYMLLFFAVTVPSIAICFIAYRMGLAGKRIFPEKKK